MSILILLPLMTAAAAIAERPRRVTVYRKQRNRFETTKTAR